MALLYLVIVLSIGAVRLYYFMIRRAAATRGVSLFYLATLYHRLAAGVPTVNPPCPTVTAIQAGGVVSFSMPTSASGTRFSPNNAKAISAATGGGASVREPTGLLDKELASALSAS